MTDIGVTRTPHGRLAPTPSPPMPSRDYTALPPEVANGLRTASLAAVADTCHFPRGTPLHTLIGHTDDGPRLRSKDLPLPISMTIPCPSQ